LHGSLHISFLNLPRQKEWAGARFAKAEYAKKNYRAINEVLR
jgi:hypothetical protein